MRTKQVECFLYHYGWVQTPEMMTQRRVNAEQIYETPELKEEEKTTDYQYGDLNRFPAYFGSHPKVMEGKVNSHKLSQEDLKSISKCFWWHPARILKLRYKTFKRVKERIV